MTGGEAYLLVQFAIKDCDGAPDWLLGLRTAAGPIVIAVKGPPDPTVHYDLVTDNVVDAVNWLVETDQEDPDREGVTALAQGLAGLIKAVRMWEVILKRKRFSGHIDTIDAMKAGEAFVAAAKVVLEPYDVEWGDPEDPLPGGKPLSEIKVPCGLPEGHEGECRPGPICKTERSCPKPVLWWEGDDE